jgi:hypothetical protein
MCDLFEHAPLADWEDKMTERQMHALFYVGCAIMGAYVFLARGI